MSGASSSVTVTGLDRVQALIEKLGQVDLTGLSEGIGALVEEQTKTRISDAKTGPDGEKWPAWSEGYKKRRRKGSSLLQDSDRLLTSIVYVARPDGAEVGTNLLYAATHQFGDPKRNIPARPFLGLSEENRAEVNDLCEEFVRGLLGEDAQSA